MSDPVAFVRVVDGRLVLDDPMADAMGEVLDSRRCRETLKHDLDRVHHFVRRIAELGLSVDECVIVILNVDDPHGGPLADILMPGVNWQTARDRGEVPFARGLAMREGIQEVLDHLDAEAAATLRGARNMTAVVVMDYGMAKVFLIAAPQPAAVMGPDFGDV